MTKAEQMLKLFEEKPLKDPKIEDLKDAPKEKIQELKAKCIECNHEFNLIVGQTENVKCPKCGADVKIAE